MTHYLTYYLTHYLTSNLISNLIHYLIHLTPHTAGQPSQEQRAGWHEATGGTNQPGTAGGLARDNRWDNRARNGSAGQPAGQSRHGAAGRRARIKHVTGHAGAQLHRPHRLSLALAASPRLAHSHTRTNRNEFPVGLPPNLQFLTPTVPESRSPRVPQSRVPESQRPRIPEFCIF